MKNQNEKYCIECASIIRKNAYTCPHCGVKQRGVNIDTEKIADATGKMVNAAIVGSITMFLLFIVFLRWVGRVVMIFGTLGGIIGAIYFSGVIGTGSYNSNEFEISMTIMIASALIGSFIYSITTTLLKKLDLDIKSSNTEEVQPVKVRVIPKEIISTEVAEIMADRDVAQWEAERILSDRTINK